MEFLRLTKTRLAEQHFFSAPQREGKKVATAWTVELEGKKEARSGLPGSIFKIQKHFLSISYIEPAS